MTSRAQVGASELIALLSDKTSFPSTLASNNEVLALSIQSVRVGLMLFLSSLREINHESPRRCGGERRRRACVSGCAQDVLWRAPGVRRRRVCHACRLAEGTICLAPAKFVTVALREQYDAGSGHCVTDPGNKKRPCKRRDADKGRRIPVRRRHETPAEGNTYTLIRIAAMRKISCDQLENDDITNVPKTKAMTSQ